MKPVLVDTSAIIGMLEHATQQPPLLDLIAQAELDSEVVTTDVTLGELAHSAHAAADETAMAARQSTFDIATVPAQVRANCERLGDAVVEAGDRVTYRQLGDRVVEATRVLLAAGVQPADRVAIWARNDCSSSRVRCQPGTPPDDRRAC